MVRALYVLSFLCVSAPLWLNAASTTTINFSVRDAANNPITNVLISITALDPLVSDGVTNLILGRTVTIRTGANGAVQTNLVPQYYLFQYRSTIPYYAANTTNYVPSTNVTVNASDLLTNTVVSVSSAYSQDQQEGRFLRRTNDYGSNSFTGAGYSNVLVRPRIFTTTALTPTTVGYVLAFGSTNGELTGISAAGLGDVTTSQLLGASNQLFLLLINYDNFSSNYLYGFLTNILARTTNGLWLELTNLVERTTNGLWAIIADATNSAVLRASNITASATNALATDLQARISASNAIYVARFTTVEASISDFMVIDDVNIVDYTTFQISDGVSDLWHVNASDGTDGATNPNLISRIGATETLAGKTLTTPTINGGTVNGATYNGVTLNGPVVNGGTFATPIITTPSFVTGIINQTNKNPTIEIGVQGGTPTLPTDTTLRWKSYGGTGAVSQLFPVAEITTPRSGATGGRTWNFQRYSDGDLLYADNADTIPSLSDIWGSSNALRASFVANDTTTSNGVLTAAQVSDITTSNGVLTAARASDTTTSNGVLTAAQVSDITTSNGVLTAVRSNLTATNLQVSIAGSNAVVGGTLFKRVFVPPFTNLNANIATLTNGSQFIVPANTLTNDGDGVVITFRGTTSTGTNAIDIIYGYETIMSISSMTNKDTIWQAQIEITRTGNTSAVADGLFQYHDGRFPGNNNLWSFIGTNKTLSCTNGTPITNVIRLASNRNVGSGISNHWHEVIFKPASR